MNSTKFLFLAAGVVPAMLLLSDAVRSEGDGIYGGDKVGGKTAPKSLATSVGGSNANPSCGTCHGPNFATGKGANVAVASRSIGLGAKTAVTVTARGSTGSKPTVKKAGFNAEVVGSGKFIAGTNNQVRAAGDQATHKDAQAVSWAFTYQADSTKTGLVSLYAVVNDSNDNGRSTGDSWAFHNTNPADTYSTPVRLFVNASGVKAKGSSCPDGNGNYAVLGAPNPPKLDATNFQLEAHGLPPAQTMYVMLGINPAFPSLSLKANGAPGCFLHTDIFISFFVKTTGTNTQQNRRMANGSYVLKAALPSSIIPKGATLQAQFAALDADSNYGWKTVWTNGIQVTTQ